MAHPQSSESERIDDLYNLLANRYRRATLSYFRESSSNVASVSDIVDEISGPGEAEHVSTQLHHYALPRLDDADVVEYDARSNTVRYRGHPDLELLKRSIASL